MNDLTAVIGPRPSSAHGECFIWSRDEDTPTIAIDAGRSTRVGGAAAKHDPKILILSHDDLDHTGGAITLLKSANKSLSELWVPVEWAILIKQLASTSHDDPLSEKSTLVDFDELDNLISSGITTATTANDDEEYLFDFLANADNNINYWNNDAIKSFESIKITSHDSIKNPEIANYSEKFIWYGEKGLGDALDRVKSRSKHIINIFKEARSSQVSIRFFSIDLALSRPTKEWETAGKPGIATLANASEAAQWNNIPVPSGLQFSLALTYLTVQNRRALCTLLWANPKTPVGGIAIWSDTDGNWLDQLQAAGFDHVVKTLKLSSAPHHASSNSAHDRIWKELNKAPETLLMIRAGGSRTQTYRTDYTNLQANRCCTWCRVPTKGNPSGLGKYQQVHASLSASGIMALNSKCILSH